jgi:hypothetical protein
MPNAPGVFDPVGARFISWLCPEPIREHDGAPGRTARWERITPLEESTATTSKCQTARAFPRKRQNQARLTEF